jgi:uncharacterized protein YjiS (DUF1127 family)
MMDEGVQHRDYRLSLLDRRGDDRRSQARVATMAWVSPPFAFDPVARRRLPLWMSPDVQVTERAPRGAETRHIPILTVIRRILATVWLWRRRARSRQQLRELSDHMLKDIGLTRENVGYEFPRPLWYRD